MKPVSVTAGSTMVPIDKVRAITNIFNGRTGTNIALYFARQGWNVTLVTSNPSLLGGKTVEGLWQPILLCISCLRIRATISSWLSRAEWMPAWNCSGTRMNDP